MLNNKESKIFYTSDDIENIVIADIAEKINVPADEIDIDRPILDYPMDSVNMVRFAASMETKLGLSEIEPTIISDYSSIREMARQFSVMHTKVKEEEKKAGLQPLFINIASSFTAEPVEESLRFWTSKIGFNPTVEFAPYNQVFQQLLNPSSNIYQQAGAINLFFVRIEDWFRFEKTKLSNDKVVETVNNFIAGMKSAAEATKGKIIISLCPHSPDMVRHLGLSDFITELDQKIINYVSSQANLELLDLRNLNKHYDISRVFDDARNKLGHIPFTQEYFMAMGAEASRKILSILSPGRKVIVLDCDNTLWQGVCGEDGALGVKISEPFLQLQQFVLNLKKSGMLLALCSKNNEVDALEVFEKHPDMLISIDDIVTHRINWKRKSLNIHSISDELRLGLDSFIFIDDNPAECEEVKSALSDVLVISLPPKIQDIPNYLSHFWMLDSGKVTHEDQSRTKLYQENKSREAFEKTLADYDEFLEQLQVKVNISLLDAKRIERAAQLTNRTNQFNATTRRYDENRLLKLLESEHTDIYSVDVSDRFGDYGFVGLMIVEKESNAYHCQSFMLSCRVLGKKVEHRMLEFLADTARVNNLSNVIIDFIPSNKNKPIEAFYESLGKSFNEISESLKVLSFIPEEITDLLGAAKVEYEAPKKEISTNSSEKTNIFPQLSNSLAEIANFKGKVVEMMRTVQSLSKLARPQLTTQFIAPRKTWEKQIATIWCDVLRMDKVGIYDNFYELGGDSLGAAEAFARMWDLGIPESVSLQTIPDPTVAGLVQAIEDVRAGKTPSLLMGEFSLEDEGDVPEDIHNIEYDVANYNTPIKNVFITGVTGYIGAFILSELFLQIDTLESVYCLVRAATKEEGIDRVKSNLSRYRLWDPSYTDKINIVLGELTEPNFGLTNTEFQSLGQNIDTIFHSGAWVNFVYPYQHLKNANVFSVETIMRLAISDLPRAIQIHFVSTLGVIMSTGYGRGNIVFEDEPLAHCEGLLNGYEQSKYVGDKMIWKGIHERGIPANIYRPGMVSGVSSTGEYHKLDEFLSSFLKGCIQLGSWPLLHTTFEIAPVDFVCKSIVHIAKNPKNIGKAYFSLHPNSRPVKDYIQWHNDFGYPMRGLPWDVWKRELLNQSLERLRKNALFPFIDFIRALSEEQIYFPPTDKSNFNQAISDLQVDCPDQLVLLERYTKYFIEAGYYEPPLSNDDFLQYVSKLKSYTPVDKIFEEVANDNLKAEKSRELEKIH